jgi:hypothetical protein
MFMKFEILSGAVTVSASVSGERGDWTVRVAPSDIGSKVAEDQTTESSWHTLFEPRPWPTLDASAWPWHREREDDDGKRGTTMTLAANFKPADTTNVF